MKLVLYSPFFLKMEKHEYRQMIKFVIFVLLYPFFPHSAQDVNNIER
jgi:hypothetical protein